MNDVDLIKKLNEINECKKKSVYFIKQNIRIVNEIVYNSLYSGEFLLIQNNLNPFPMVQKNVVWYFLNDTNCIFFIKNNIWFNISCENSSVYFIYPSHIQKVESVDDDIVVEYIEFILSHKNIISDRLDSKIECLKPLPEQMDSFINCFRDKLK